MKIKAVINEIENKKENQWSQSQSFEKINKVNKSLARLIKIKNQNYQYQEWEATLLKIP